MNTNKKKIRLQSILIISVIVELLLLFGLNALIYTQGAGESIQYAVDQMRNEVDKRVLLHIEYFSKIPDTINMLNRDAVLDGDLKIMDHNSERKLYHQVVAFRTVSRIYYGDQATGCFVGMHKKGDTPQLMVSDPATGYLTYYYNMDSQGNRKSLAKIIPGIYDPRLRPWYQEAVKSKMSHWSKIYSDWGTGYLCVSLARPVYTKDAKLAGVCCVDLFTHDISSFLYELHQDIPGSTFIVDKDGYLVAASFSDNRDNIGLESEQLIRAEESDSPIIRAACHTIKGNKENFTQIRTTERFEFDFAGEDQMLQVVPYSDQYGLEWLIVTMIPENVFMEKIYSKNRAMLILLFISCFLAILVGIRISRMISRPVSLLAEAADSIAAGELDQHVDNSHITEIDMLTQSFNSMGQQLKSLFENMESLVRERTSELSVTNKHLQDEITERIKAEEYIRHMASHDPLTNIPNRKLILDLLEKAMAWSQRRNELLGLMFLDLDDFKSVNDRFGHGSGDFVLQEIVRRVKSVLRSSDLMGRLGGDEFILILPGVSGRIEASAIAEKILKQIHRSYDIMDHEVILGASIGIVLFPNMAKDAQELISMADAAMYNAKNSGKNCNCFYEIENNQDKKTTDDGGDEIGQ